MQSISTKYLSPTNTKGARIKATTSEGKSLTACFDYGVNEEKRHMDAAKLLCEKLGWTGTMQGGSTATGKVFVFVDSSLRFKIKGEQKHAKI